MAAQVVNFLILLLILKKFLYKPILKVLESRRERIEESLKQAEEIERKLAEAAEHKDKIIEEAAKQAEKIINEGNQARESLMEDGKQRGEQLAQKIVQEARTQLQLEKQQLQSDVRADAIDLVLLITQKITGKSFNKKEQKDLIEKTLKELRT